MGEEWAQNFHLQRPISLECAGGGGVQTPNFGEKFVSETHTYWYTRNEILGKGCKRSCSSCTLSSKYYWTFPSSLPQFLPNVSEFLPNVSQFLPNVSQFLQKLFQISLKVFPKFISKFTQIFLKVLKIYTRNFFFNFLLISLKFVNT